MPKVLVSEKLNASALQIFASRGIEAVVQTNLGTAELLNVIGDYDGIVIRTGTKLTADVLEAAKRLKVIGRAGTTLDNVDIPAATAKGIVVMNTPHGNALATAEHAIALMLTLARNIAPASADTKAGVWDRAPYLGVELTGKTLGILGYGNIGAIVAERAQALKMRVITFDPFLSTERAREQTVEKVDLDTLLARSDVISLHAPLTETTRDIINAGTLAKMKKGVFLVNCARGGLIDEAALKAALESGHVRGAALDVFKVEPPKDNPLIALKEVVATPHLGSSTSEAYEAVAVLIAEQVSDYLLTGAITNAVNMPSVSAEDAPKLRPYLTLAAQLGGFAGQSVETAIAQVRVEYSGHVATLNTKPLTAVILAGLLKPMNESVNMVNAPIIAKARDICVSEVLNEVGDDYQTLIRLVVVSDTQTQSSVTGTLFSGSRPRLVAIDDIPVEAELGRHMLSVTNRDKPGLIGALGTLLGEHGINIATFNLGRTKPGGDAILLAQVDQPLSEDLMTKVRAIPQVVKAKVMRF